MSDSDIKKDTFPNARKVNVLDGLPEYLKEPEAYDKVRKLVLESLAGSCSHGEVVEWAKCPSCQRRFAEKGQVLKKLGFKSARQYLLWQRIHEQMRTMERVILKKYDE